MNRWILISIVFSLLGLLYLVGLTTKEMYGDRGESLTYYGPTPSPQESLISAEKLMSTVNDWRYSQGLQIYKNDERLCELANARAVESQLDFSHKAFYKRVDSSSVGFGYKDLAENLISGYNDENKALNIWLSSPTHLKNLKYNYSHSCIGCDNNYCVQIFANF